jgi:hypothetical protein
VRDADRAAPEAAAQHVEHGAVERSSPDRSTS